jgi:hypothetical protein
MTYMLSLSLTISTEHKNIQIESSGEQVLVDGHHRVLPVQLAVSDGAAALCPGDGWVNVEGFLDLI